MHSAGTGTVGTDCASTRTWASSVRGRPAGEYADGCPFDFTAPIGVHIDPDHDSWVVGDEPAVLIEVDFGPHTVERLGIPGAHSH